MADPLSTVAGAAAGAAMKAAIDLIVGLGGGKKKPDPETEKVLLEIEARLLATKKEVLGLEQKMIQLEDENFQLRAKIRSHEERAAERQKYKPRKTASGATVMVRRDQPGISYCATCFAKDLFIPLQPVASVMERRWGTHDAG
jgi:hypothetical protein